MKAFISYSHVDGRYLERLHVHLAQLQREQIISTWTDKQILAGGKLDNEISNSLNSSDLFIALLSPDYINSNYCYEKEFEKALEMQKSNQIIIIPVIVEDCDWLNTPFQQFKALPKDGKPISEWNSENTAFLNVIQEIRNLTSGVANQKSQSETKVSNTLSKNYKIKQDFDSIQKLEFEEKTFDEVKKYLLVNISELESLDGIIAKVTGDEPKIFEAILVNRKMIKMESTLIINIDNNRNRLYQQLHNSDHALNVTLNGSDNSNQEFSYSLSFDEYNLFWKINSFQNFAQNINHETEKLSSKQLSEEIWEIWLKGIGIEF
jgi:hypothetical protein